MIKEQIKMLILAVLAVLCFSSIASAQGFSSLMGKLNELEARLDGLDSGSNVDVAKLENTIALLENQVNRLSSDFDGLNNKDSDMAPSPDNRMISALAGDLRELVGELHSTIEKAPKDVGKHETKTSVKSIKSPVKLELKAYSLYHHDATEGDGQSNSFDISRVYIGAKYSMSDEFNARYLTDISHASGGGKFEVYTKYAYLDWSLSKYHVKLTFGLQALQTWKQAESEWGYRVIRYSPTESFGKYWGSVKGDYEDHLSNWAEALLDTSGGRTPSQDDIALAHELETQEANFHISSHTKMGSSADMGIGLNLKLSKTSYANFIVRNGTGYKEAENDMYKNFQLRAGNYFLEKALHLSAFVEVEPFRGVEKTYRNLQWDLFASYKTKTNFLMGVNVNSKIFAGSNENITAMCYSAFGHFYLKPNLKAIARYDQYIAGFNDVLLPSGGAALKTNANLLILGFDFIPDKHIHIVPNVQIQTFEDPDSDKQTAFYLHLQYKL